MPANGRWDLTRRLKGKRLLLIAEKRIIEVLIAQLHDYHLKLNAFVKWSLYALIFVVYLKLTFRHRASSI